MLDSVKLEFDEAIIGGTRQFVSLLNGKDVSSEIRSKEVSRAVSTVSKHPEVRRRLMKYQHDFAKKHDIVCDGRDMGTVVFKEADHKFFLVADVYERAKRRHREMLEMGIDISFEEVLANIENRDDIDSSREASPLKPAEDAEIIDTTNLSVEEVVETILSKIKKACAER